MKLLSVFLLLVLLFIYSVSSTAAIQEFDISSYQNILHKKKQDNFILILWSLDCPPCIEELPVISSFHKKHTDIEIIMVSTDEQSRVNEISKLMDENDLSDLDHWIYRAGEYQKISYSIDPYWYGELPRSYFYNTGRRSQSFSGRLAKQRLQDWFYQRNKPSTGVNTK